MSQIFGLIKLTMNKVDPATQQVVGQQTREVTKCFDGLDPSEEIREWTMAQGATSCTLLFESEPKGD